MAFGRGASAYKAQAEAAAERGKGGFSSIMLLKDGDTVLGRFRGLLVTPNYHYSEDELLGMSEEEQAFLAWTLGIVQTYESAKDFAAAVLKRYGEEEPLVYCQHYVARNKGRDAYVTCSAAWEPATDCVGCYLRDSGDKAVSARDLAAFSFKTTRKLHIVTKKDQSKDYIYCTEDEGSCKLCAQRNEPKQENMKYFAFPASHSAIVFAYLDRVRKKCAACGTGKIKNEGWMCANPYCRAELTNYNYDAEAPREANVVKCGACKMSFVPDEMLSCSNSCPAVRRCQLFDVDTLVQRIGGDKKTTYSITEDAPASLFPDELLSVELAQFEKILKPKPVAEQCRLYGLHENPFTGAAIHVQTTESYDEAPADENTEVQDPYQ